MCTYDMVRESLVAGCVGLSATVQYEVMPSVESTESLGCSCVRGGGDAHANSRPYILCQCRVSRRWNLLSIVNNWVWL